MEWPALAELTRGVFPEDVIARAKELQSEIGSIGAYSHSQGVPFIRKNVARFIEGTLILNAALSFLPVPPHPIPYGRAEAPRFSHPPNQALALANTHIYTPTTSFLS